MSAQLVFFLSECNTLFTMDGQWDVHWSVPWGSDVAHTHSHTAASEPALHTGSVQLCGWNDALTTPGLGVQIPPGSAICLSSLVSVGTQLWQRYWARVSTKNRLVRGIRHFCWARAHTHTHLCLIFTQYSGHLHKGALWCQPQWINETDISRWREIVCFCGFFLEVSTPFKAINISLFCSRVFNPVCLSK